MTIVYVIYSFNSSGDKELFEIWDNELEVNDRMTEIHANDMFHFLVVPTVVRGSITPRTSDTQH